VALLCGGKGLSPQEPAPSAENPFTPLNGRIGDPAMVFGRESKVNEALELLRRGSSVVFLGDHGSGKSSLLTLLIERVSKDLGWKIAHLDLLLVEDEDSFYRELCLALGVPEARGYPLKRSLTGKRFLLALDEMERMASQGFTRNIRDQLRGLADGPSEPLKLAMAASTSLDRLFPDSEEAKISPLAGICQQIQVGPWDIATAREFLLERLETTSVTFSEAEIGQIFKESMGMPRELMHKAFHLYRRKIEQEP